MNRFLTYAGAVLCCVLNMCLPLKAFAEAQSFVEQCLTQYQQVVGQLPYNIDVVTACQCQETKLASRGYNTSNFHSTMTGVLNNLKTPEGESPLNDYDSRQIKSAYSKMMMDTSISFMACIQKEVKDAVKVKYAKPNGRNM